MTALDLDHFVQSMCVGMHRNGILVDQVDRAAWDLKLQADAAKWRLACQQAAGIPSFNPGSFPQVADVLYDKFGLLPVGWTDGGDPSTEDACLRRMVSDPTLSPTQREMVHRIRRYRKMTKIRGTYVKRFDPLADDTVVYPDGRVHPTWNAHVTSVFRLSCSAPNIQNISNKGAFNLQSMFIAGPGRRLVAADADQIHLRIIASLWRVARLLECFHAGRDPHALLAADFFGSTFMHAPGHPGGAGGKWSGKAKDLRSVAKTVRYAGAYGATAETIYRTLTKAEDADGKLVYADKFTLRDVRAMLDKWMKAEPEWPAAWAAEVKRFREQGYSTEPITGKRCYFPVGADERDGWNEIVNWPILASEAGFMHCCAVDLLREIPFEKWGPGTGLVAQVHDSLALEVPEAHAETAAMVLQEAMTRWLPGFEVPFTAEAHVGLRLSEV